MNTALGTLTFTAPATPQFVNVTLAVTDNGNTGTGGPLGDSDPFVILAADPLPVVTTSGGSVTYTENGPALAVDTGVTVADNGAWDAATREGTGLSIVRALVTEELDGELSLVADHGLRAEVAFPAS